MSVERRFFFIHVMKTGGSTFRQHILANFPRHQLYPMGGGHKDLIRANLDVDYVMSLPRDELDRIRVFSGHFPYAFRDMLEFETTALTILRDPVARTISYLKHCKRYHPHHRELGLDEIYDDPFYFKCFVKNFQSKLFCIGHGDEKIHGMIDIEVDDARLEVAKDNLAKVDIIGLTENYSAFLADVEDRLGWKCEAGRDRRVSTETWEVSDKVRKRIIADNAADIEFYNHAKALHAQRAAHDKSVAR